MNGRYEAYKLALAIYTYRALGLGDKVEEYKAKQLSINPYTTLYRDNTGEGDLNLETAAITLLALYSTQKPIHDTILVVVTIILIVIVSVILTLRLLLLKCDIHSRTRRQHIAVYPVFHRYYLVSLRPRILWLNNLSYTMIQSSRA